jgi:ribosomal protein S18 acetylase RimI-like enzyme
VVASRSGERVVGLAAWTSLRWDSVQFGFPAARLEFLAGEDREALLEECLEQARSRGVRHLVTRFPAGDVEAVRLLTQAGFEFLDGIQTLSRRAAVAEPRAAGMEIRPFRPADLPQVLEIAQGSYVFDRFHADRALGACTADRINEAWVRSCCDGRAADLVLIAANGERILGYVASRMDRRSRPFLGIGLATIVMVATSVHARRRGVARALTEASLACLARRGADLVEVGTQLANTPAVRLYEACGFRQVRCSLTLRKLL